MEGGDGTPNYGSDGARPPGHGLSDAPSSGAEAVAGRSHQGTRYASPAALNSPQIAHRTASASPGTPPTVEDGASGASSAPGTSGPKPANASKTPVFPGHVLRCETVGLSQEEIAADRAAGGASLNMPASGQCQVNFDEPHVVTEIRLVPNGLKAGANMPPEHQQWTGLTAPGIFDLAVFYAPLTKKSGPGSAEASKAGKFEALNKRQLRYDEKNKVQSLYTWKFTGKSQPIETQTILFRGTFQCLSVCIIGKTLEEFKRDQSEIKPAEEVKSPVVVSPPSAPSPPEPAPPKPVNGAAPATALPAIKVERATSSPSKTAEDNRTLLSSAQMSPPQMEDGHSAMDVDGENLEAPSRPRRMSDASSTSSPLMARTKGRDSIGDRMREVAKTLSLQEVRKTVAQALSSEDSFPGIRFDSARWTEVVVVASEHLAARPGFESGLASREEWGTKLASVLDGAIEIIGSTVASKLGRTSEAGIATLCKAISVALDPDTGCMTKDALTAGLTLIIKLIAVGGEVSDQALKSGLVQSLIRLLRDPLTTIPLRLHCVEMLVQLMDEPAACLFFTTGSVSSGMDMDMDLDQDDYAAPETLLESLLSTTTQMRLPLGFQDLLTAGIKKVATYEALARIKFLAESDGDDMDSDCSPTPEDVLDEIIECLTAIARSVAAVEDFGTTCASTDVSFPYGQFKAGNLAGSVSRILSLRKFRTLPAFGSRLLPLLTRFLVAICLDVKGLEWLAGEHAECGCISVWEACLADSAPTFAAFSQLGAADDVFDAEDVRRCPGIYTSTTLMKSLFNNKNSPAADMDRSRRHLEAVSLAESTIRNNSLTYLEAPQIPILLAYTLQAYADFRILTSGVDSSMTARILLELEEMTAFEVGREAMMHILAVSKPAFDVIVAFAADTEAAGTSRIALELISHFVQHPLSFTRLKDPGSLERVSAIVNADTAMSALLSPWLSVLEVLKSNGVTGVLDLVVKPVHPTATDLANPQVVVKMTAALSILLQTLVQNPAQVLGNRISSEEVAGLETRRGLLERILGMLSRASEILVKVAEPVTSVRAGAPTGKSSAQGAVEKKEIKLEDLRAERSRATSPTPAEKVEPKPAAPVETDSAAATVTVQITTEMIQLRRQILDLLFILLKMLRAVMLTAYDASNKSVLTTTRPSIRKHFAVAVAAEDPADGVIESHLPKIVDEAKIPKTPLFAVVSTLLDVLQALDFVDIRGTDFAGGALITPSPDSFQSTGTIIDEYQSSKLGDFYVVGKAKQTIAALVAAMGGAVMFEIDPDGMQLPLDETFHVVTRRASLLGGFEEGYGRQTVMLPRFMEPASSVFSDILVRFAWKEPGNAWIATQLLNELLPAPLPVLADLDGALLRDYLARGQDEDDLDQLELTADLDAGSGGAPQLRTYLAKELSVVLPQLLDLVKAGAGSSTRQFHLAIRTLVLRAVDLDVNDTGLARALLGLVLDSLAKVLEETKGRPTLSTLPRTSSTNEMDGADTMMDGAMTNSPVATTALLSAALDEATGSIPNLQKVASEAARWLSILCGIAYLPAGRALLLCARDQAGELIEKPATRTLALLTDLIQVLGSSTIATDLALETLQWIFTARSTLPDEGDDGTVFWDTPEEADISSVFTFALDVLRSSKDERIRSQILLLVSTVAESTAGARTLLGVAALKRSLRDMLDAFLDLLSVKNAGAPVKIGVHELDIAIALLSTFKMLSESAVARRSSTHFLAEGASIPEHEERVLRLNVLASQAQELMETNGQRAMQMAERGSFDDEAAGMLDPGLFASLAELTRFLIGAMSASEALSGEYLLDSALVKQGEAVEGAGEELPEVDRADSSVLQGEEGGARKRTFAETMWSRPTIVPLAERGELYMADLEDESAALLFETVGEEVDLEAMAKEVLPDLSLRKKLRYSADINLADITRSKFQRGGGGRSERGRGGRGGQTGSKQPYRQYKRDEFRTGHPTRKANTSRAPSMHVDDFVKQSSGGPAGPATPQQGQKGLAPGSGGKPGERRQSGGGLQQQQQQQGDRRQSGGTLGSAGRSLYASQGQQLNRTPPSQQRQGGAQSQDRYGQQQGQRSLQQMPTQSRAQGMGMGMGSAGPQVGSVNQMPLRGGQQQQQLQTRGGQGAYGAQQQQAQAAGTWAGYAPNQTRGGQAGYSPAPPPPPPRGGQAAPEQFNEGTRYGPARQGGYYQQQTQPPPPPNQRGGYAPRR